MARRFALGILLRWLDWGRVWGIPGDVGRPIGRAPEANARCVMRPTRGGAAAWRGSGASLEAPRTDLAADDETAEQLEGRVLRGQRVLGFHAADGTSTTWKPASRTGGDSPAAMLPRAARFSRSSWWDGSSSNRETTEPTSSAGRRQTTVYPVAARRQTPEMGAVGSTSLRCLRRAWPGAEPGSSSSSVSHAATAW
jgi:hypothetical protein